MSEAKHTVREPSRESRTVERDHHAQGSPSYSDDPISRIQRSAGNQAVQQLLRSPSLQPKLAISNPADIEEREADAVAQTIMRNAAASPVVSPCSCAEGQTCDTCKQAESATSVNRNAASGGPVLSGTHAQGTIHEVLRSSGQPLDAPTRAFFEPRFGHDLSGVRVHSDSAANQSAREVNANAYTVGRDIVFGEGRFTPGTQEGRHLLAHELTHVVQQSGASSIAIQRDADQDLTDDRVRDLKEYVATHPSPYQHVIEVIRFSKAQELDDNVSADFIESQSSAQLEQWASTEEGREMLDVMYDAMMTGHVTTHETLQADRILYAKWKSSPAEIMKIAQLRDPESPLNPAIMDFVRKRADLLTEYVARKRYRDVINTVRQDSSIEDDIASRFIALQSPDRLEAFAASDDGRAMLDVLYDALITGDVTGFERLQADRILAAKAKTIRPPTGADVAKVLSEPAIFPLATGWGSTATIYAELLENGKVMVRYDSSTGLRSPEFARERASLYQRYGEDEVFSGITLEPDELVIVRLFDHGGSTETVPAIKLIDFFNQQKEDTLGKIKAVSIMGATVGLGGIGAGGILGWSDTIAFAINAGTLFINANRDVIARTALGRRFLEVWDVAEGIVEYYNWGRLGMDGLKLVHATVSAPFKRWQQEVPEGLTSVERETIAKAQQETEAWLDAVKKAEAAEAAKARPAGSESRTGYSRTPPASEEEIAGAAGRTRRPRPGAIDRGKGSARPSYANDPVGPKTPGVPELQAMLPGGKWIRPDSYSGGFHGTQEPPEQVMKSGLPARGDNWDLQNHAEELWHYKPAGQQVNDSAFRGTSSVPSDPANQSGAAYFAGEGGYVYEIRGVPTWDVNKALQGRVGPTGSMRGNLMHGEGEYAIPARVTPDKIKRWGVVKSNTRGQLYVEWH
jgi:uncharacterized protein DUF4157